MHEKLEQKKRKNWNRQMRGTKVTDSRRGRRGEQENGNRAPLPTSFDFTRNSIKYYIIIKIPTKINIEEARYSDDGARRNDNIGEGVLVTLILDDRGHVT